MLLLGLIVSPTGFVAFCFFRSVISDGWVKALTLRWSPSVTDGLVGEAAAALNRRLPPPDAIARYSAPPAEPLARAA